MQPVTIKNHEIINGLWFSQGLLTIVMVVGGLVLPWQWSLWVLVLMPVLYYNDKRIRSTPTWSLILNQDRQFYILVNDEIETAELASYWHLSRNLWLMISSPQHKHYCLIKQSRVGGPRYARLLMGLNALNIKQDE